MVFHVYIYMSYMSTVALCYAAFACVWKVALKEAKAGKASADFALKTLRLGTLSLGRRLKQLCTTKTLIIPQHLNTKFLIAPMLQNSCSWWPLVACFNMSVSA